MKIHWKNLFLTGLVSVIPPLFIVPIVAAASNTTETGLLYFLAGLLIGAMFGLFFPIFSEKN